MATEKKPELFIAFRGTAEYRENLHDEARRRKIKLQEMLERALEVYLKGDPAAEVAARRMIEQQQAPPNHQLIAVPDEMVEIIATFVKWFKGQKAE